VEEGSQDSKAHHYKNEWCATGGDEALFSLFSLAGFSHQQGWNYAGPERSSSAGIANGN
jgi:hypothetical protein